MIEKSEFLDKIMPLWEGYEKKLGKMGVDIENMEITIDSDGVEKLQSQLIMLHARLRQLEGEEE